MAPLNQHLSRLMGKESATPQDMSLPIYESLPNAPRRSSSSGDLSDDRLSIPSSSSTTYPDHHSQQCSSSPPSPNNNKSPKLSLNAFLSNLTLGFADGLTVPFALTAGLSSLGSTKTVIYAGMAEICAGSISMGIGGYLAARGDHNASSSSSSKSPSPLPPSVSSSPSSEGLLLRHHSSSQNEEEDEKSLHLLSSESCTWKAQIEGMNLPADLEEKVLRHLDGKKPVIEEKDEACGGKESPVLSGLSVSLGYLLGGSLPLFPYFFLRAEDDPVKKGLVWSFVVCVVALFVFGFGKEFVLGYNDSERTLKGEEEEEEKNGIWWTGKRIRVCVWEGVQMVVLGSVAAGAAVLCVRAFEGMS